MEEKNEGKGQTAIYNELEGKNEGKIANCNFKYSVRIGLVKKEISKQRSDEVRELLSWICITEGYSKACCFSIRSRTPHSQR